MDKNGALFLAGFCADKYSIENGGKGKNTKQLNTINNAYFALDDIEAGVAIKITLWMFGLLY